MLSAQLAAHIERPPVAIVADTATTTERNIDRWARLVSDVTPMVVTPVVVTPVVVMAVVVMAVVVMAASVITIASKGCHVIPHVMDRRLEPRHQQVVRFHVKTVLPLFP